MSNAQDTEQRLHTSTVERVGEVIGIKAAQMLGQQVFEGDYESGERESVTEKLARLRQTERGRARLAGVRSWEDIERA